MIPVFKLSKRHAEHSPRIRGDDPIGKDGVFPAE